MYFWRNPKKYLVVPALFIAHYFGFFLHWLIYVLQHTIIIHFHPAFEHSKARKSNIRYVLFNIALINSYSLCIILCAINLPLSSNEFRNKQGNMVPEGAQSVHMCSGELVGLQEYTGYRGR